MGGTSTFVCVHEIEREREGKEGRGQGKGWRLGPRVEC